MIGVNGIRNDELPTRATRRGDGERNDRKLGANGQSSCESGRGRKPPKQRRPKSGITSALICEHADDTAFAQKPHATQKLFASIKEDDSRLCSYAPDIAINERICQRLVNAPEAILGKSFSQMGVEFPIPRMADKRDPSKVAMFLGHV